MDFVLAFLAIACLAKLGARPARMIFDEQRVWQAGEFLGAVVDYLVAKERMPARDQVLNDLLSLMACHAAVKAGDRLTADEIASLVAQRHLVHDPHHCPHGRPTSLLLSRQELDRQFRRT